MFQGSEQSWQLGSIVGQGYGLWTAAEKEMQKLAEIVAVEGGAVCGGRMLKGGQHLAGEECQGSKARRISKMAVLWVYMRKTQFCVCRNQRHCRSYCSCNPALFSLVLGIKNVPNFTVVRKHCRKIAGVRRALGHFYRFESAACDYVIGLFPQCMCWEMVTS